ncbi:MAG TPA: Ni/Fe-hydrogenase, b-type cytochrome subunit [Steroidobacteraceae bacterium]
MSMQISAGEFKAGTTVKVYSATVRLWHWVNALCIVVLVISGLLIAMPPPSVGGEASDHYIMGYIRFAHFTAGYVMAVAFLVRIYAAIVGNEHARSLFWVPFTDRQWRAGFVHQVRWYLFLEPASGRYVGHNPLAHVMMFLFLILMIFMIVTGFALYSEGAGEGSWQDTLFGWVIPLFGGSQALHSWHHLGMWAVVTFVILHVYAAIREEIMSRQTMLGVIVSGTRTFRN